MRAPRAVFALCLLCPAVSAAAARPKEGAALIQDLWPDPFPPVGAKSLRAGLTARARRKTRSLGLSGMKGLDGETVSRAVALFPRDRARAGVITFEIEGGARHGIHQCEALGRGITSFDPKGAKPGWRTGVIKEPDGRETTVHYAPEDQEDGAAIPGIYDLRNIRPDEYKIGFLNKSKDLAGEEALAKRLSPPDRDKKPFYSGVWKTWYPRDPRYSNVVPVDLIWSERDNPGVPVYEKPGVKKDPEQVSHNPRYYAGPYGRYGMAIHTDRWDDPDRAADPQYAGKNELRNFLFRDTAGCIKVHPDCLLLINAFIDEQKAKGRTVQLDVREVNR